MQAGLGLGSASFILIHFQALLSLSGKWEALCFQESSVKHSKWGHGAWWWVTVTLWMVGRPMPAGPPTHHYLTSLHLTAQVLFQASDVGRQAVKRKAVTASSSLPQTWWLIFQGRLIREYQAKMINKSNRHPSFNETLFIFLSLNFEIILQRAWLTQGKDPGHPGSCCPAYFEGTERNQKAFHLFLQGK